jgi:lipoyl(octanoyl) transferase
VTSPQILRPGTIAHGGRMLTPYADALAFMETLADRPPTAPDVILLVEHPPVLTLGRKGGAEFTGTVAAEVWPIARGGSITWHAPGQIVAYPIVQLARIDGPVGRGPFGDLPGYARLLEAALQEACGAFGVATVLRTGFTGVWCDDRRKIASIGVGMRGGWTLHGLALNVCPHLDQFDSIVPCGLDGVRMTSLWQQLDEARLTRPSLVEVAMELTESLTKRLRRRAP